MTELSIIIVSWNVKDFVGRLIKSIFLHTSAINFEVVVVDNNSDDNTVDFVRSQFPQVRLIANAKNRGFAAACNQGIRASSGEFVILLNPDAEILDNSLAHLVSWMREHPKVGISSGKVLNPDHSIQASVRQFPTVLSQTIVMLKLHHLFPQSQSVSRYFAKDFDYSHEQEVDQVIGAFFCIRRTVFVDIGLFDENFFLWYEEVDFSKRAKARGWQIRYVPTVSIIHHGGQSFSQVLAAKKQRYLNRSLVVYARKHFSRGAVLLFQILSPVSILLAWVVQTVKIRPSAYRKT